MIDIATSVRLLLALVVLVYGYLVAMGSPGRRRLVLAAVGIVPFFVWIVAPGALSMGEMGVALGVRRIALLASAAAVALRYASVRSRERSHAARRAMSVVASALLLASLAVGSSNWLVAAAAVVTAFAAAPVSPSGASSHEGRPPRRDPRGT